MAEGALNTEQATLICQNCGTYYPFGQNPPTCPSDGGRLMPAQTETLIGTLIGDRYRVLDIIGTGGWGTVYKAADISNSSNVAVKIMHRHLCSNAESVKRFSREAQALSSLDHPNLTKVFATGFLATGQPYIAMELLTGKALSTVIQEEERFTAKRLVPIIKQVCGALHAAHARGIIHRDLKPAHIILLPGDQVKVVDFGLAKVEGSGSMTALTQTGQTVGTPEYMSPEQCMAGELDARSDIYSLGLVMFEALTGTKAVEAETVFEAMHKHVSAEFLTLSEVRTDIAFPPRLEIIVSRCLQKEPTKRFSSCVALSTALNDAFASSAAISTTTAMEPKSVVQSAIKSSGGLWVGGAVGAAVVLLVLSLTGRVSAPLQQPIKNKVEAVKAVPEQEIAVAKPAPVEAVVPVVVPKPESHDVKAQKPAERRLRREPINEASEPDPGAPKKQVAIATPPQQRPADGASLIPATTQPGFGQVEARQLDRGLLTIMREKDAAVVRAKLDAITSPDELTGLNLSYSRVNDATVKYILEHFKQLHGLNLAFTHVSDAAFEGLSQTQLFSLYVPGCKVTSRLFQYIAETPTLTTLTLTGDRFKDKDLEAMASTNLRYVILTRTAISDNSAKTFSQMRNLKLLVLNQTAFTDVGVQGLADCKLHGISLVRTNISDESMRVLAAMPRLKDLMVNGTSVGDAGLEALTASRSLRFLDITDTRVGPDFAKILARIGTLRAVAVDADMLTAENRAILKDAGIGIAKRYVPFGKVRLEADQ